MPQKQQAAAPAGQPQYVKLATKNNAQTKRWAVRMMVHNASFNKLPYDRQRLINKAFDELCDKLNESMGDE